MNQEDQQIEQYQPLQSKDIDWYSNMWKIGWALNEEVIGQIRKEYFIYK